MMTVKAAATNASEELTLAKVKALLHEIENALASRDKGKRLHDIVAARGPPTALQRFIRAKELPDLVGLSKPQIDVMIRNDEFPKPVPISDTGRAVAWLENEIIAWQAKRAAQPRVPRPDMREFKGRRRPRA